MSEDQNKVNQALNTANAVRGAVKTGKAIANATRGGIAGGILGSAVKVTVGNKKIVLVIVLGLVLLLLIPVIIICMLPMMIFSVFNIDYSDVDINSPVLNNNAVIVRNMEFIDNTIEYVLQEGINLQLDKIEKDMATYPSDTKFQVIQPTVEELNIDGNQIMSEYCASMDSDYKSISIKNLQEVIREHLNDIFTYERDTDIRLVEKEYTIHNIFTGSKYTITREVQERHITYTVKYKGNEYFADNVFMLSDKQKELASSYDENLETYMNGGV